MTGIADFVEAAGRAASQAPAYTFEVAPAGVRVRICLAGAGLVDELSDGLLKAEPGGDPVVELFAFDSAGTGVRPPAPPWPVDAFIGNRSEIAGYNAPPRIALYDQEFATLSFYDEDAAAGVQWFRSAAAMAPGEGGAPLRNLLRWSLAPHGVHLTHAAAVGGVLICGPAGAGKSTTSLACALAGMPFSSDDFSAITTDGTPTAHAVFAYAKTTDQTIAMLPGLAEFGEAGRDWRGKLRLFVADRVVRSQQVGALVLPVRAERTGRPRELPAAEALRRATAGNLTVMPGATAQSLTALAELLRLIPAYEIELGPEMDSIPEAIAAVGAPAGSTA